MWWILISGPYSNRLYWWFFFLLSSHSPGIPEFSSREPQAWAKASSLLLFKPERSGEGKSPAKSSRSQWTECMLFYSLGYDDVMLSKDGKMSSISTEGPNPVIHYSELEASFSDGETTLQITHMHAHHVASICIHIDHLAILSEISGRTIRKVVPPPLSFF